MDIAEKKKTIKRIIDQLPDEDLDLAIQFAEELVGKNEERKAILRSLLNSEKSLFERLAK